MSQEQQQNPQEIAAAASQSHEQQQGEKQDTIKYGDVFPSISGELAVKPIVLPPAALMQAAANLVHGQFQKGGVASVMQPSATKNKRAVVVGNTDVGEVYGDQGATVTETDVPGRRTAAEPVGGQVVTEYSRPLPTATPAATLDAVTIGEALEAITITAGNKAVDQSDAAAIQAAEMSATGSSTILPGGIASEAQSAASANALKEIDADKTKLADLLKDATLKLRMDKAVSSEDAEAVSSAELRNNPKMAKYPGGVSASMAAAARLNTENA